MKFLAIALGLTLPIAAHAAKLLVDSPDIKPAKPIAEVHVFNGFGCEGANLSPSLAWKNPPNGTKSFAVTVYDPDAPTGSGWWHWVVFNLPADTQGLEAGAGDPANDKMPAGAVQSRTDFGKPGWGGPCPPKGDKPHRYVFTVHALKVEKLDLDENATAAMVGFMIRANELARASITARHGRK
ncbi:MAG: YbhB/YbcL family Raf kinase inhibitor-like protein [Rhodocyclaceae bacterium]|jgi:Raf kinase inhibitor-like YbhB/YbcL family protein|nr:YbhB/YbcL family Raf kinase inhibitor-like protein [Rhodocyclaceae bacterium]